MRCTFLFSAPYDCVDTEHTLRLLKNILEGVEYIHSRGIMHRDLKVTLILLFHCHFSLSLRCSFTVRHTLSILHKRDVLHLPAIEDKLKETFRQNFA